MFVSRATACQGSSLIQPRSVSFTSFNVGSSALSLQARFTSTGEYMRSRTRIGKLTKKLEEVQHPHPSKLMKKFRVKKDKFYLPPGVSRKEMEEKSAAEPHTPEPRKQKARDTELLRIIFDSAKKYDPETAFDAYHRLSMVPDIRVFTVLIKSCETNPDYLAEAIQIYNDIKKVGLTPNVITFQTLMNCCLVASHWQRGMFFFKEYLRYIEPPAQPTRQHLKFYNTLLALLKAENRADRAIVVFEHMNSLGYVEEFIGGKWKNAPVAENKEAKAAEQEGATDAAQTEGEKPQEKQPRRYRTIPREFVSQFVSDENEGLRFWEEMRKAKDPSFTGVVSQEDSIYTNSSFSFMQDFYNAFPLYETKSYEDTHSFIAESDLTPYIPNDGVRNIVRDYLTTTVEQTTKKFFSGDAKCWSIVDLNHKLHGVSEEKALKHLKPFDRDFSERFMLAETPEEIESLYKEYDDVKTEVRRNLATKLKWKPVVIGVDGKPFFPKNVSMKKLTADDVKSAKDQYLNSIADPQLRKEIEEDLMDRVKLCWYDKSTGRLIPGLFY